MSEKLKTLLQVGNDILIQEHPSTRSAIVSLYGVKFEVIRGSSDVAVHAKEFRQGRSPAHVSKYITDIDPTITPDFRGVTVYGATLEVPLKGIPVITTTGTVEYAKNYTAPVVKTGIGDSAGNGWLYASEPTWDGKVTIVKPLQNGPHTYLAAEFSAERAQYDEGITNAHIPSKEEVRNISMGLQKMGLSDTFWTSSGWGLIPGQKTIMRLNPKDRKRDARIAVNSPKNSSKHAVILFATAKI